LSSELENVREDAVSSTPAAVKLEMYVEPDKKLVEAMRRSLGLVNDSSTRRRPSSWFRAYICPGRPTVTPPSVAPVNRRTFPYASLSLTVYVVEVEAEIEVFDAQSVHSDILSEVSAVRMVKVKGELAVWYPMYKRLDGTICKSVVLDRWNNPDVGLLNRNT
jgi:hypothetical protein